MKPKLILCLALVLNAALFGCSTSSRPSAAVASADRKSDSSGLVCALSVPSSKVSEYGTLPAALILKNEGSKPIRVCTWWGPIPFGNNLDGINLELGVVLLDFTLVSGLRSFSSIVIQHDQSQEGELRSYVRTLRPDESLQLPFEIGVGTDTTRFGTNLVLCITTHFASSTNNIPKTFNCWYGKIDAKPLTIKIER
jgi:hypothetical protein